MMFDRNEVAHRVVVGVSQNRLDAQLLVWAAGQASRLRAGLTLLCGYGPYGPLTDLGPASHLLIASRDLATERLAAALGVVTNTHPRLMVEQLAVNENPIDVLGAATCSAALTVVGTGRLRTPWASLLGGGAVTGLNPAADGPLAVVPPHVRYRPRQPIAVAVNRPADSGSALEYASRLARLTGAELRVLHVARGSPRRQADFVIDDLIAQHPDVSTEVQVLHGDTAEQLALAAVNASLLIIGSRGLDRVSARLRASTGRKVLRQCATPVIVVRAGASNLALAG